MVEVGIILAITGASGAIYGLTLLKMLTDQGVETHVIVSTWGQKTLELETGCSLEQVRNLATVCYAENDLAAPLASGSFKISGMIVAPCSMKTLACISHGLSHNLIGRAAEVTLKERRPLILVPRETPLNLIHLENLHKAALAGAVIFPPVPAFYVQPQTIQDMVSHTAGRILDQLGLSPQEMIRWGTLPTRGAGGDL